jgi:hypothetical protein
MFVTRTPAISLAAAALAGCAGGGDSDAKVASEALVSDGPSGCVVQAEVGTGPDTSGFSGGVCLSGVVFHLFDRAGDELPVDGSLNIVPADERVRFRLRICSGEIQPFDPAGLNVDVPSTPSLFLVADAGACPAGTTVPGDLGLEAHLASPLREVPCEDVSRLETDVFGCDD